jgi:hypothetical protein
MKTLFTFLFTITFLSTYAQSTSTCGCIQVLSTPNIHMIKAEQFAFTTDTALVEKAIVNNKETNRILFCYNNFNKAILLMNEFAKHFPTVVVIERKSTQVESLPKLFINTI